LNYSYSGARKRRPAVARMYTKIKQNRQKKIERNRNEIYMEYHDVYLVERLLQQNLKDNRLIIEFEIEYILPNNDFKYSVAFSGVFSIDERPNIKKDYSKFVL